MIVPHKTFNTGKQMHSAQLSSAATRSSSSRLGRSRRTRLARAAHAVIERLEQRALFTVTTSTPAEATIDPSYSGGSLGVNLNSNDDYRTAALWTDLRNEMGAWSYAGSNGTALSGADVTPSGYPTGTAADQGAYTITSALGYPDGVYTLQYQGNGTIAVTGNATIVPGSTTTTTLNNVTTTTAQVTLLKDTGGDMVLTANNFTTAAPLSNLHFMMPGFSVNTTQVFNPAVIARLKTFNTLRLMDLFKINNSSLANWANRPLATDFTQTAANGISYEDAIALGNETGVNLWWNIPIDATNAFVTNVADLLKYGSNASGTPYISTQANPVNAPLNPGIKVTIELANEIFNAGTVAQVDNDTAAQANPYLETTQPNIDGQESLFRTRQIYDLFSSVYGSGMSSQVNFIWTAYFDSLTGTALPYTTSAITFAGENNGQTGDNNPANWGPLSSWLSGIATSDYHGLVAGQNPTDLTTLFADLNADFQQYGPSAEQAMVAYVDQLSINLPLLAYEGGVSLPLYTSNTPLYTQASSDPRMDTFEQTMLDSWYSNGGAAFNQYSFVDGYSYYGYWGMLTSEDQAGNNKFDGIIKRLVTPGDANLDNSVDFADFLTLKANWGLTGASWEQGDFNSDGSVNLADLQILENNIDTSTFTPAQLAEYNSFIQYATTGTPNSSVGTGLYGAYYSDLNQTTKVFGEVDPEINFNWPQSGPGPGSGAVSQGYFSAEWTGEIEAPTSETYEFHTYANDGIRVYITVNGTKDLIINDYNSGSHEDVGNIALQAGQMYPIEVDYFQEYGGANVQLEWQTPTIPLENVPTMMLYPTMPPAVVTGLTATPVTAGITLSFPAVAGATSYNIYRSTVSGGEGSTPYLTGLTGTGTITTTDTQVTPGRTYYYTATAVNLAGETAQSAEAYAVAASASGVPASPVITASSGSNKITLSWPTVSGATTYNIYRGTTPGGESVTPIVTGLTATTFADFTGLPGTTYYYTVTATNTNGSSAFSNEVSGAPTLPIEPSLIDTDIGSPAKTGSATYNLTNGIYSVSGGGADIYGQGDQFNYDYTTLAGSQTLIARVTSETDTDYSTKAGLMFRQSNGNADSYADIMLTPGQGIVFEWRNAPYGTYSSTAVAGISGPVWLKLDRSGNTFTGYYSLDGFNWNTVASETIAMNTNLLAGLAVCAHNNSLLATATFTNVKLGSCPDVTTLPSATVSAAGTTAALNVAATEFGGSALTYTWSTASLPTGVTTQPTFPSSNGTSTANAVNVTLPAIGTYTFDVSIADSSSQSIVLPVSVTVGQVLTSIAITPPSPVSVSAGGTITFAASALDQFGSALVTQPTITWSLNNGGAGSINASTGLYTASTTVGSTASITAANGAVSNSVSLTTTASQTPVSLTGTIIGTSGSYDGTSTIAKVFDNNLNTFFDAANPGTAASPNWAGLDLGSAYVIASITYAPRIGFESRMVNGYFQASNDPTFTTGDVTLATITTTPTDGYTTISTSATGSYRYVRYVAPAGGYGNIAELKITGTPGVAPTVTTAPAATVSAAGTTAALTVAASETGNPALTYTWTSTTLPTGVTAAPTFSATNGTTTGNAVTASLAATGTYGFNVKITDPSGNFVLVPLSVTVGQVLTNITVTPASPVSVTAGGTQTFAASALDQFGLVLATQPAFTWSLANGSAGSLVSTTGVYTASSTVGSTATVEATAGTVVGTASVTAVTASQLPVPLTGTIIGTPGSYDGVSTIAKVFDNNLTTFFDAATAGTAGSPNWVGLALSASDKIATITYAPRVGFESRMVGGYFQASNSSTFATGDVTLATITTTPADGYTTLTLTGSGSYTFVRYVSPAGGYGNIAELKFTGTTGVVPTVTTAPAATISAAGTTAALTVAAAEAGNPTLTYTWSAVTLPTGVTAAPTFSATNGTSTGNAVAATFAAAGTYGLTVTITDPSSGSTTVPLSVTVAQVLTSIAVSPASPVSVAVSTNQTFTATALDQFGLALVTQPTFTWSVANGSAGSIVSSTGVYTASATVGSAATVQATSAAIVGTASVTAVSASQVPTTLTGTIIGTSGSYDGTSTIAKVFDGNLTTYFDSASPGTVSSPNWVGLDLGSIYTITSITFAPRVGFESRMVGGYFQASNDPTFTTGDVTMATITAAPADGYTTVNSSATGSYRYVRYVAPAGSYGNIAELKFAGTSASTSTPPSTPGTPTLVYATSTAAQITWTASTDSVGIAYYKIDRNGTQVGTSSTNTYTDTGLTPATPYAYTVYAVDLAGNVSTVSPTLNTATTTALTSSTIIGTSGSYDGTSTIAKVFDGNLTTFFDAATAGTAGSPNWIGLDFGSGTTHTVTAISYAPRVGFESRMLGGVFQESNDPTFSTGVVTLATVTTTPPDGFTTIAVNGLPGYRYIRYVAPAGGYGNIAELQFFGTP
jgi:regulation of enolase protein 1 (concanavalin A-like superfamily)